MLASVLLAVGDPHVITRPPTPIGKGKRAYQLAMSNGRSFARAAEGLPDSRPAAGNARTVNRPRWGRSPKLS